MPSVITPEVAQYLESALEMDDVEEFPIPTEKAEVIPINHEQKADIEAIEADLLRRAEVDLKMVADKKDWSVAKPGLDSRKSIWHIVHSLKVFFFFFFF